jgi:hypothetical protein
MFNGKTESVSFEENGLNYTLTVKYGMRACEGQEPYFSITAELSNNQGMEASGCLHNIIRDKMPRLSPLIKWHCCSVNSGPMHYEANGLFWWERINAPLIDSCAMEENALQYFEETVVYGVAKTYDILDESILKHHNGNADEKAFMQKWLRARLPEVMKAFHNDMKLFGVLE